MRSARGPGLPARERSAGLSSSIQASALPVRAPDARHLASFWVGRVYFSLLHRVTLSSTLPCAANFAHFPIDSTSWTCSWAPRCTVDNPNGFQRTAKGNDLLGMVSRCGEDKSRFARRPEPSAHRRRLLPAMLLSPSPPQLPPPARMSSSSVRLFAPRPRLRRRVCTRICMRSQCLRWSNLV